MSFTLMMKGGHLAADRLCGLTLTSFYAAKPNEPPLPCFQIIIVVKHQCERHLYVCIF